MIVPIFKHMSTLDYNNHFNQTIVGFVGSNVCIQLDYIVS